MLDSHLRAAQQHCARQAEQLRQQEEDCNEQLQQAVSLRALWSHASAPAPLPASQATFWEGGAAPTALQNSRGDGVVVLPAQLPMPAATFLGVAARRHAPPVLRPRCAHAVQEYEMNEVQSRLVAECSKYQSEVRCSGRLSSRALQYRVCVCA